MTPDYLEAVHNNFWVAVCTGLLFGSVIAIDKLYAFIDRRRDYDLDC